MTKDKYSLIIFQELYRHGRARARVVNLVRSPVWVGSSCAAGSRCRSTRRSPCRTSRRWSCRCQIGPSSLTSSRRPANQVVTRLVGSVSDGMSVAVGAGRRGLTDRIDLLRGTIDGLRSLGAEPFVVPAMGSHGGGTAEGQQRMLHSLGLTEEALDAEIRSRWRPSSSLRPPTGCRSTSTNTLRTPIASCPSTASSRTPHSPARSRAAAPRWPSSASASNRARRRSTPAVPR